MEFLDRQVFDRIAEGMHSAVFYLHDFLAHVDSEDPALRLAFAAIVFNPIFWNFVARNEWNNRSLTNLFGDKHYGCYSLAATIFLLGVARDYLALDAQPAMAELELPVFKFAGALLFLLGNIFVVSSMYALGLTGTYLGDYFGILMDERVTSFPFNILENPMYVGSTMSFVGTSLWYAKPAGILLSLWVAFMYSLAMFFEGPFTTKIYTLRDEYLKRKADTAHRVKAE